ncbi:nitroreductase family protein [Alkalihalobacillus trypoxylicola]|uniref:Nitroreductase domain-containing protein n=1 Tax=Alkalihalobacillus trypoxylicola TaxID=519424 RepID=A0A161PK26_9BACI|nr:nitroreductase family protein [Alkalihalobacillus trypoxylicola]KYG33747.1 hypothetical protein AZF04_16125 [Alkalihalobacillus trypoxylicola]
MDVNQEQKWLKPMENRLSCRSFIKKKIEKEILYDMIRAGTLAPSSGNMQPWEFVIIDNEETQSSIVAQTFAGFYSEQAPMQAWILEAPILLVACANYKRTKARYGDLANKWVEIDTASAVQNILLAGVNYGVYGCWVGGFKEKSVSKLLKLPPYIKPIGLIPLGYPSFIGKPKYKMDPTWITHHNEYNQSFFI